MSASGCGRRRKPTALPQMHAIPRMHAIPQIYLERKEVSFMFKKILVATDGSEYSHKGLEAAADLAQRDPDMEIHLVHVIDSLLLTRIGDLGHYSGSVSFEKDMQDILQKEAEDMLARAAKYLRQNVTANKIVTHLEFGYPPKLICCCAKKNEADLIIVGSKGSRGVERLLMGSVAGEVVNQTAINVLILK
jgi:nucleotide-binding universal stress UspA family protein